MLGELKPKGPKGSNAVGSYGMPELREKNQSLPEREIERASEREQEREREREPCCCCCVGEGAGVEGVGCGV